MVRLKQLYKDEIVAQLQKKFDYKTVMQVPTITKITLNMGVGEALGDKKVMAFATSDMEKISGQKPIVTKAKNQLLVLKFVRAGL